MPRKRHRKLAMDELALKNHKPLREIAGAFCFCLKPGKQLTGTVHRLGTTRKAPPARPVMGKSQAPPAPSIKRPASMGPLGGVVDLG